MKLSEMKGLMEGVEISNGQVRWIVRAFMKSIHDPRELDDEMIKIEASVRAAEAMSLLQDIVNNHKRVPIRITVETLEDDSL